MRSAAHARGMRLSGVSASQPQSDGRGGVGPAPWADGAAGARVGGSSRLACADALADGGEAAAVFMSTPCTEVWSGEAAPDWQSACQVPTAASSRGDPAASRGCGGWCACGIRSCRWASCQLQHRGHSRPSPGNDARETRWRRRAPRARPHRTGGVPVADRVRCAGGRAVVAPWSLRGRPDPWAASPVSTPPPTGSTPHPGPPGRGRLAQAHAEPPLRDRNRAGPCIRCHPTHQEPDQRRCDPGPAHGPIGGAPCRSIASPQASQPFQLSGFSYHSAPTRPAGR